MFMLVWLNYLSISILSVNNIDYNIRFTGINIFTSVKYTTLLASTIRINKFLNINSTLQINSFPFYFFDRIFIYTMEMELANAYMFKMFLNFTCFEYFEKLSSSIGTY